MFPSPSLSMYRFPPAPPRVSSFSSVSNPLLSLPLHPELLSELSSLLAPSTQYPSPALSLLTFVLSISLRRLHICAAVVFISAVILFSSPIASLIYPSLSLFLSSGMSHPPPPTFGILQLLAPPRAPRAPLPPAPAAGIARKDKDVGDRTIRVGSRWPVAGGSTTCGKFPSRPLAMVGDGISRPLFLYRHQKYHPLHCRPAFRNLHARADGARGGAGPVPGATAAPIDRLADLSA